MGVWGSFALMLPLLLAACTILYLLSFFRDRFFRQQQVRIWRRGGLTGGVPAEKLKPG